MSTISVLSCQRECRETRGIVCRRQSYQWAATKHQLTCRQLASRIDGNAQILVLTHSDKHAEQTGAVAG